MLGTAAAVSSRLIAAAMPPSCLACGMPVADEGGLCAGCWGRLRLIERPFCDKLSIPFSYDLGAGALSAEAIANPPPFDRMRAVALYDGVARELVHALKYGDHLEIAQWMAGWMHRAGAEIIADADLIVPVPLFRRRLWSRRFNQAAALVAAIAKRAGKPYALSAVTRIRRTENQVGLTRKARQANVRGAFRVDEAHRPQIAGRRVLIVDDVATTGATLGAVTRSLGRAGAAGVDALVFARVAHEAI